MESKTASQVMLEMLTGFWTTQAIYMAAKLGIADLVSSRPQTAAELAKATGTHGPSLYRLLRMLAGAGIFAEDSGGRFGMTPLAQCLVDEPGSQRAAAIMMGEEHYRSWGDIEYSIRTGKPAFDHLFGQPVFDYLSQHPVQAKNFDAAMTGIHGPETQAMLDTYDFTGIATLIDVGGGNGSVLCAILRKYPSLRGILYDLPGVIERAQAHIAQAGLADRCQAAAGSFFEQVPGGADAYLMRHIIHDWTDAQCTTILGNCRKAMGPTARILVVESVIPPGNEPAFVKQLDMNMLLIPGGQERTEAEYRTLFERAGLRLTGIVPTTMEISIIEGKPL
jgi:hypothetical protein